MIKKRISKNEYYKRIVNVVALRSTCLRRSTGAIIVKKGRIISSGYAGPPAGVPHCEKCVREEYESGERLDLSRGICAERNAIIFAARYGISIEGATMYSTILPCFSCSKEIINSGIKKVVVFGHYADEKGKEFLKQGGVELFFCGVI